jgi:hypothetical protein
VNAHFGRRGLSVCKEQRMKERNIIGMSRDKMAADDARGFISFKKKNKNNSFIYLIIELII